jgi:hypothetical protein
MPVVGSQLPEVANQLHGYIQRVPEIAFWVNLCQNCSGTGQKQKEAKTYPAHSQSINSYFIQSLFHILPGHKNGSSSDTKPFKNISHECKQQTPRNILTRRSRGFRSI